MTSEGKELEASFFQDSMIHHSIASTIAGVSGNHMQLLAQDPEYTDQAKDILQEAGFSIVGQFGAGGFVEVDDSSVVFSVFREAHLKQVIEDIAPHAPL